MLAKAKPSFFQVFGDVMAPSSVPILSRSSACSGLSEDAPSTGRASHLCGLGTHHSCLLDKFALGIPLLSEQLCSIIHHLHVSFTLQFLSFFGECCQCSLPLFSPAAPLCFLVLHLLHMCSSQLLVSRVTGIHFGFNSLLFFQVSCLIHSFLSPLTFP